MAHKCKQLSIDSSFYTWQVCKAIKDVAVAAGWTVYDSYGYDASAAKTSPQWIVVRIDMSGGTYGDEIAYVRIYVGSTFVILVLYQSWNATTHTGSNYASGSGTSGPDISISTDYTLLISADTKFLWVQGVDSSGNYSGSPACVSGFERFPHDTKDLSTSTRKTVRIIHLNSNFSPERYPLVTLPMISNNTGDDAYLVSNNHPYTGTPERYYTLGNQYADQCNETILLSYTPKNAYLDPDGSGQLRDYCLGKASAIRYAPSYGSNNMVINDGTIFPNILYQEWLIVTTNTAFKWCGDNM